MKRLGISFILLFLLIISSFSGFACLNKEYTATFYIDNEIVAEQITKGYVSKQSFGEKEEISDVFDGWYTDSNYTQKFNFSTKIKKNISLYARNISYLQTFKIILEKEGKYVTIEKTHIDKAEGLAVRLEGQTSHNHSDAYLMMFEGSLHILEENTENTDYHYSFMWDIETIPENRSKETGTFYVISQETHENLFYCNFRTTYQFGLETIPASDIIVSRSYSDYLEFVGNEKALETLVNYTKLLDNLISQYVNL